MPFFAAGGVATQRDARRRLAPLHDYQPAHGAYCELQKNRPNFALFPIVFSGSSADCPLFRVIFNRKLGDYSAIRSNQLFEYTRIAIQLWAANPDIENDLLVSRVEKKSTSA
jgi:hypothetical protein